MFFELFSLKIKLCISIKVMNLDGLKSSDISTCGSSTDCSAGNGDALAGTEGLVTVFLHEQLPPWHLKASAK